jgi:hypothetical protein
MPEKSFARHAGIGDDQPFMDQVEVQSAHHQGDLFWTLVSRCPKGPLKEPRWPPRSLLGLLLMHNASDPDMPMSDTIFNALCASSLALTAMVILTLFYS